MLVMTQDTCLGSPNKPHENGSIAQSELEEDVSPALLAPSMQEEAHVRTHLRVLACSLALWRQACRLAYLQGSQQQLLRLADDKTLRDGLTTFPFSVDAEEAFAKDQRPGRARGSLPLLMVVLCGPAGLACIRSFGQRLEPWSATAMAAAQPPKLPSEASV